MAIDLTKAIRGGAMYLLLRNTMASFEPAISRSQYSNARATTPDDVRTSMRQNSRGTERTITAVE